MQTVAPIRRKFSRNLVRFETKFQQNFEFFLRRKIYFFHFRDIKCLRNHYARVDPHSELGCLEYYLHIIILDYPWY